jgi:serine/threonine protein kinase
MLGEYPSRLHRCRPKLTYQQIFELACGQPPIDAMFATPTSIAEEMLESTDDDLPQRWHEKYRTMNSEWTGEKPENRLQGWLEEIYFDERKRQDFTRQDIVKVGNLVRRLLRFEPSTRASVDEILQDPWFKDENWEELLRSKSDSKESTSEEVSKPQVVSAVGTVRP